MYEEHNVKELEGKIIRDIKINNNDDEIIFILEDDTKYSMNHHQDCCESVSIQDICGDIEDLINTPIIEAREDVSGQDPDDITKDDEYRESFTWTFYNFRTIKGSVTIRWYGTSNGYYSESVDFDKL